MLLHRAAVSALWTVFCSSTNSHCGRRLHHSTLSRMQGIVAYRPHAIMSGRCQRYAVHPVWHRERSILLQRSLHTNLTANSQTQHCTKSSAASSACHKNNLKEPASSSVTTDSESDTSNTQLFHLPPTRSLAFWLDPPTWRQSAINTIHCLLGCSIGDLSALFLFANYFPHVPMLVVMPIAMTSGIASSTLLETLRLKYALPSLGWRGAVRTALNMSFLSMLTMEAAENVTNIFLAHSMGDAVGMAAADTMPSVSSMLMMDTQHPYFLVSLVLSTLAGFLAPLPYNYYVVRRFNKRCH